MNTLLNLLNNTSLITCTEYGFLYLLVSTLIYFFLIFSVFCIFFLFNFTTIKFLSDLNFLVFNIFLHSTFFLLLLSLAGIPPFAGFISKFFLFTFFFYSHNYFIICYFTILNFFFIFFYIQNLRLIFSENKFYTKNITFFLKQNVFFFSMNPIIIIFLIVINLMNCFGIFFFEDLLLLLGMINIYIF